MRAAREPELQCPEANHPQALVSDELLKDRHRVGQMLYDVKGTYDIESLISETC